MTIDLNKDIFLKARHRRETPRVAFGLSLVRSARCVLFDWGGTLMKDFSDFTGPMVGWPHVEAVEHVLEVLAELHKVWMLALATNAVDSNEEEIWAALKRVGLDQLLDRVYCFRKIGHKKPSPEFFAYVLNDLSLDPLSVFMVGDDFESDVMGSVRCGIRAIWFNGRSDEVRKTKMYDTIHDFRLLPNALSAFANDTCAQGVPHTSKRNLTVQWKSAQLLHVLVVIGTVTGWLTYQ